MFNSFSGDDGQRVEWKQLLPFPEEDGVKPKEALSKVTLNTVKRLIKENKIPDSTLTAILMVSPEIQSFLAKEY